MCVYSNIGGYAQDMWPKPWPTAPVVPMVPYYPTDEPGFYALPYDGPTKEQVQELIELLKSAKRFDKKTNQPDCEVEEKKEFIRELCEHFGINVPKDLFK